MKKVLVTGATGFIGTYVVSELLKNNYYVIATSSDDRGFESGLVKENLEFIYFDLNKFDDSINYYEFFKCPDSLIHLAWQGLPNYKSLLHYEDYLPKQYTFLKNLIRNGLMDVSVTGTCLEYGMQEGCLSEEMPSLPSNPYALAKDTLRKFLTELQSFFSFKFRWIRLFYMHGKGQGVNSLLSQLQSALDKNEESFNMSGGEQIRDYLPVEKVAENIVEISMQDEVYGIINCCSGIPVTVKELVTGFLNVKNKSIKLNFGFYPYPDYEPMHFWGDTSKLNKILKK